ncbi:hypothetical protein [Massilia sp. MS-15]|uniref:hypothetical protein n=1 Tax=Massilia sp. MS-15 TaxID=2878200 RepID=UPI001CD2D4DF|nr:hypothetical protein [Massilia sp. MS-15]MCA1247560.1 hypothetical protein [Massilia sp. MS-15]
MSSPKAFDFGEEPAPPAPLAPAAPRAFEFDETQHAGPTPAPAGPPTALNFDGPAAPGPAGTARSPAARPLFDSEDHPAVRDALALAWADYPALAAQAEQRLAALFRRILPVRLSLVTEWGEDALAEQAVLLQQVAALVLQFAQMAVPALLDAALASTREPAGVFGRLFRRPPGPADYKPALDTARSQLLRFMVDSEAATGKLEASAHSLGLHGAVLAVVARLAAGADAGLQDALLQRRTLIQHAIRQAELSILQMAQLRQQSADLAAQVSSFLTVTLPALELARTQDARPGGK